MEFRHFTTGTPIPERVLGGIEEVANGYLVDYEEGASSPVASPPAGRVTEQDILRAPVDEEGTVEEAFDESLVRGLMSHRGAHLLVAEAAPSPAGGNEILGFSIFFTDPASLPEQAEDIAEVMADYMPFCWLFYVVVRAGTEQRVMLSLVRRSLGIMAENGCDYLLADYMVHPTVCGAGKRMMELSGFRHAGRRYGLGLMSPEDRGAGNELRNDVYEIMVKDLRGRSRIWNRSPDA